MATYPAPFLTMVNI